MKNAARFFVLVLILSFGCAGACNADVSYTSPRHVFIRNENPSILLSIGNEMPNNLEGIQLKAMVDGIEMGGKKGITLAALSTTKLQVALDTEKIRAGNYKIVISLFDSQSREILQRTFPFGVTEPPKDKMRVWLWPHAKFGKSVCRLDDRAMKTLNWYADKGFDSFQPGGDVDHKDDHKGLSRGKLDLFDMALSKDWEMGFAAAGGFNENIDSPGATFEPLNFSKTKKLFTNPFHPEVIKSQVRSNLNIMEQVKGFPSVKTCFFNTEKEDKLPACLPPFKNAFIPVQGSTVPHKFILPGVIPDNDEGYIRHKNRYEWTDGLSVANQRAANLVHTFRPDISVFSDPLRRTVLLDRYRGMSLVSTWTYTNPDPKYMLFIETLIANAAPSKKGVMHTITMLNYPGSVAPKKYGWTLMGGDRLLETSWINLSRRPDKLSIYLSSMCDPFNPDIPKLNEKFKTDTTPYQLNPGSFEAFKNFSLKIIKPFGAMIKKLERSKRKVAILSSEASRVYSASPPLLGYYSNYQIYCFYSLLNMAHIPTDVVFEETIKTGGLDRYDILVLAKCDTLLESTYNAILDFQARGGIVVADQYLRAPIPKPVTFDFNFEYRTKVSADAILKNKSSTTFTDHLDARSRSMKKVKGVTALDDQKIMSNYATRLKEGLNGLVNRSFDCSTDTVLLNTLKKDQAQYLFVINDKRTYGKRFGRYKAILEKSVPQTVTITAKGRSISAPRVYDMVEGKELKTRIVGNDVQFDVSLSSLGGKIIAVLPVGIRNVAIKLPKSINKRCIEYDLNIRIQDNKNHPLCGVTPLKIEITDPEGTPSALSGYYAADHGELTIKFLPAVNDIAGEWNVKATELISGKSAVQSMRLESIPLESPPVSR